MATEPVDINTLLQEMEELKKNKAELEIELNKRLTNENKCKVHKCQCGKVYNFKQGLSKHRKTCLFNIEQKQMKDIRQKYINQANNVQLNTLNPLLNDATNYGYIYIIQEREFILQNIPIYKIGKTTVGFQRFSGYPKGSNIILYVECTRSCHIVEQELIKLFKTKYKQRTDIGTEYFEGLKQSMIYDVYSMAFVYGFCNTLIETP